MVEHIFYWLRTDVFGPEMFGLIVEFFIVLIIVPTFAYIWRRSNLSRRISQLGAELSAKLSRVQNAIVEIVIAIEETINKAELLQAKFRVSSEELQALLSGDKQDLDEIPRNLSQEEKDFLAELRTKYFDEVANFREASDSSRFFLNALNQGHNLDDVVGAVLDVQEAIRTIHRYSVRENLIADFKDTTLPKVDRLLNIELKVGKYRFVRENVSRLIDNNIPNRQPITFSFGRPTEKRA